MTLADRWDRHPRNIATSAVALMFTTAVVAACSGDTGTRANIPTTTESPVGVATASPPTAATGLPTDVTPTLTATDSTGVTDTPVPEPTEIVTASSTPLVRVAGEPRWWIDQFSGGNTDEGHLYFGVTIENLSESVVWVGVSFRAYRANGTPFPGCTAIGGEGPGVSDTISPHQRAVLRCSRTIVDTDTTGLQITAKLWDVAELETKPETFQVLNVEANLARQRRKGAYEPHALIRSATGDEEEVVVIFRFYSEDGTQVGTCESDVVDLEPTVDQRVGCFFPLLLDSGDAQPVAVRAGAN